jgi:hypothetical protein
VVASKTGSNTTTATSSAPQLTPMSVLSAKEYHLRTIMRCLSDGTTANRSSAMKSTVHVVDIITQLESQLVEMSSNRGQVHGVIAGMLDEAAMLNEGVSKQVSRLVEIEESLRSGAFEVEVLAGELRNSIDRINKILNPTSLVVDDDEYVAPVVATNLRREDREGVSSVG